MGNPDKILDSLLVVSYKAGDKKALGLLVNRWNKKLCVHAYGYTKDWQSAKDITQDTWSTVMTKIHFLRDTNSFGSWIMTIASRKALDSIKRKKKYVREFDESYLNDKAMDIAQFDDSENTIQLVSNAIANLQIDQKMVLKLFYIEEYSVKEISIITGVSLNTVKTRLFRAREKMKSLIKK